MQVVEIQELIQAGLPDAQVEVNSRDGVHFEALVISEAFSGMRPIARHQAVYAALGDRMGGEIHALSLKTMAPDEVGN
jgi:acid stress-induced BolA-like protein IbaG/YrbA